MVMKAHCAICEDQRQKLDARQRQRLAREHPAGGQGVCWDAEISGDITGTDIFIQCATHGVHDFALRNVHRGKFT